MITLRKSGERGYADHGWLKSFHSFSFADYHDPRHMGVGNLRVINEDRIAPGTGFGTHGHRDMEIVSYVLDGALAHKDSMGNGSGDRSKPDGVIRPGDVQRMSAGTGVMHSEFNHARDAATHFLQIWVIPDRRGIAPSYEQKHFDAAAKRGRLALIAARDGRDGAVTIHADASIHAGLFDGDERAERALDPARPVYVHLVRGRLRVNDRPLEAGDALTLQGETGLVVEGGEQAEVLVFDLAPLN
jgi:redox-sensitive bicupin YhaK (pirin superfamily)